MRPRLVLVVVVLFLSVDGSLSQIGNNGLLNVEPTSERTANTKVVVEDREQNSGKDASLLDMTTQIQQAFLPGVKGSKKGIVGITVIILACIFIGSWLANFGRKKESSLLAAVGITVALIPLVVFLILHVTMESVMGVDKTGVRKLVIMWYIIPGLLGVGIYMIYGGFKQDVGPMGKVAMMLTGGTCIVLTVISTILTIEWNPFLAFFLVLGFMIIFSFSIFGSMILLNPTMTNTKKNAALGFLLMSVSPLVYGMINYRALDNRVGLGPLIVAAPVYVSVIVTISLAAGIIASISAFKSMQILEPMTFVLLVLIVSSLLLLGMLVRILVYSSPDETAEATFVSTAVWIFGGLGFLATIYAQLYLMTARAFDFGASKADKRLPARGLLEERINKAVSVCHGIDKHSRPHPDQCDMNECVQEHHCNGPSPEMLLKYVRLITGDRSSTRQCVGLQSHYKRIIDPDATVMADCGILELQHDVLHYRAVFEELIDHRIWIDAECEGCMEIEIRSGPLSRDLITPIPILCTGGTECGDRTQPSLGVQLHPDREVWTVELVLRYPNNYESITTIEVSSQETSIEEIPLRLTGAGLEQTLPGLISTTMNVYVDNFEDLSISGEVDCDPLECMKVVTEYQSKLNSQISSKCGQITRDLVSPTVFHISLCDVNSIVLTLPSGHERQLILHSIVPPTCPSLEGIAHTRIRAKTCAVNSEVLLSNSTSVKSTFVRIFVYLVSVGLTVVYGERTSTDPHPAGNYTRVALLLTVFVTWMAILRLFSTITAFFMHKKISGATKLFFTEIVTLMFFVSVVLVQAGVLAEGPWQPRGPKWTAPLLLILYGSEAIFYLYQMAGAAHRRSLQGLLTDIFSTGLRSGSRAIVREMYRREWGDIVSLSSPILSAHEHTRTCHVGSACPVQDESKYVWGRERADIRTYVQTSNPETLFDAGDHGTVLPDLEARKVFGGRRTCGRIGHIDKLIPTVIELVMGVLLPLYDIADEHTLGMLDTLLGKPASTPLSLSTFIQEDDFCESANPGVVKSAMMEYVLICWEWDGTNVRDRRMMELSVLERYKCSMTDMIVATWSSRVSRIQAGNTVTPQDLARQIDSIGAMFSAVLLSNLKDPSSEVVEELMILANHLASTSSLALLSANCGVRVSTTATKLLSQHGIRDSLPTFDEVNRLLADKLSGLGVKTCTHSKMLDTKLGVTNSPKELLALARTESTDVVGRFLVDVAIVIELYGAVQSSKASKSQ